MRDRWSIGVKSILSDLRNGNFESIDDIDKKIDESISELEEARNIIKEIFLKRAGCEHEYEPSTFTIERRIAGFIRVNKRICNCGHTEVFQENKSGSDRPEWAKDAQPMYFNNSI